MEHTKNDKGYVWSIVTVVIGVLITIAYLIPQVIHEHQIEEDRMQRLERTISKQQEDIDALENKLISIMEDLNGNQIPHHVYAYHLRDDFYVKFAIVGGTSFAGLIKTDDPKSIYTIIADNTIIDIHNKNQLVEFVTSYSKLSITVLNDVYNQGIN